MSNTKGKIINPGIEGYIDAQQYYYVDKTLLIRDIVGTGGHIKLITRPRRFGKTLNLDMIRVFFEKTDKDTSVYFRDKKIWQADDKIINMQGKYPVIFISLKEAENTTWDGAYAEMQILISDEFKRHRELASCTELDPDDIISFNKIKSRDAKEEDFVNSIKLLSRMLYEYYGVKPVILIDEYDSPIQAGYNNGFDNEILAFMKSFLSASLKTNLNIAFAVITGICRISGESLFSGFNNFKSFSVLNRTFSEYFGFTKDEVHEMLEYYGLESLYNEICKWYDGYMFGNTEIFNPWSVLNYVMDYMLDERLASEYWTHTSSNIIISNMVSNATPEVAAGLAALSNGETIEATIQENLTYKQLNESSNIYSMLLFSGYLKSVGRTADGKYLVRIPNKEVKNVFEDEISKKTSIYRTRFDELWNAIEHLDEGLIECTIGKFLQKIMSYYNNAYESFYQCFMMCVGEYRSNKYFIYSEAEAGDGRLDVCFEPKDIHDLGYIFELKSIRKKDLDTGADDKKSETMQLLKAEALEALEQINYNGYEMFLTKRGISNIAKIGIAFMGKHAKVAIDKTKSI